MYQKPLLFSVNDLAEGVYADSGSATVTAQYLSEETNQWTQEIDAKFKVILTGEHSDHQIVTLTFSGEITAVWGGGSSVSCSGSVATLDLWNPADSFEITVHGRTKNLSFVSGSIRKAN